MKNKNRAMNQKNEKIQTVKARVFCVQQYHPMRKL